MRVWQNLDWLSTANSLVILIFAFVLGSLIGLERQYRQRTAGLRTNALVAVGAALFVDLGMLVFGDEGASRVISYVVSGVGFLGAGVIMREQGNVRGINTAATLWGSAAVGAACGAGYITEAVLGALFVLAANTLLRPVVNQINRQPLDVSTAEITHILYVIANKHQQKAALNLVELCLEAAKYPSRDLEVSPFGEHEVEISATLAADSVAGDELDMISRRIMQKPYVTQAYWSTSTTE